ncbi:hypothetical protein OsJ_06329 [Oryza sativa Japonica Group]|uniref:Uncharacterized protein n=1 Tax=Oryza sativa subsp. japonica TaxID=39947 RepID=A3A5R9_ORYSJ|nr:hypothetical protein OsJ_06329 [Oryza sativa Japonica Group]
MRKEELDYVLIPLGMALMVGYHAWLLLRIRRRPATTVIGVNAINRRIWVRHIMELPHRHPHVLRRRAAAADGLLPGAPLVVGAAGETALSVKFFAILVCFLVAFLLNVQSIRYYSHTSTLVNVPVRLIQRRRRPGLAVDYVTATLNRGSYFWSLGARAFYFSCPVFLWLFGPIPMFAACAAMVCALYFLDVCDDWEEEHQDHDEQDGSGSDERSGEAKV